MFANLELKTPSELLNDITKLRNALEQIDALAVRHEKGAIGKAQKIARLALTNGERK